MDGLRAPGTCFLVASCWSSEAKKTLKPLSSGTWCQESFDQTAFGNETAKEKSMWPISRGNGGQSWSGSTSHTGPEERLEVPISKTLWRTLALEERNDYRNWPLQGKVNSADEVGHTRALCFMRLAPCTSHSSYAAALLLTTKDEPPSDPSSSSSA